MSEKRILRVGLIQQANTADHSDNKQPSEGSHPLGSSPRR